MNTNVQANEHKKLLIICSLILLIISFILYPVLSNVDTYSSMYKTLDEKRNTVLLLTASSSAASAIITLIPDDVGTPIAEQLANLSTGFSLILIILLTEKYLLPILGGISTVILSIGAILLFIYCVKYDLKALRNIAIKIVVLAIAFSSIIPAGIWLTETIDTTFEVSINGIIDKALDNGDSLNVEKEKDKNLWEKITGAVSGALDYVGKALAIAKNVLGSFVDAIAVMIVTCCVIPLLVIFVYLKIIKYVFHLDFSITGGAKAVFIQQRKYRLIYRNNRLK